MKPIKILALFVALIASFAPLAAQNNTITPYSRFGYGVLRDNVSSAQAAMGGVGYAMNNGRQINVMNPASYAAIDTLTFLFDIGVDFKYLTTTQQSIGSTQKGHNTTGGLNYVTMQFPVTKYMGASVGLLPYSQVGYSFGEDIQNGESAFSGSGSINQVYAGLSGKLFKGFTIGLNVSYLFGTLLNDEYVTADNGSQTLFERSVEVSDYDIRFGAQYSFNIGQKNRFTLGAVYSLGKKFLGEAEGIMYDTSMDTEPKSLGCISLKENASRPATHGAGINYIWDDRFLVEADFTYQPWKDCKIPELEVDGYQIVGLSEFDNRWKAALGFQFMPDPRGNYFKRIRYRLGGYLNHDYITVRGFDGALNNVRDLGVTLGLGLPAPISRMTKTVVNVGFEYHRRYSTPASLVTENYFQVTLGINFNELWFWQSKIQ